MGKTLKKVFIINKDNWFVLLFFLPGLVFMFLGDMWYQHEMTAVEWPYVPGIIITVAVNPPNEEDDCYSIEWKYSYEVDGKTYIGSSFSPSGNGTNFQRKNDALKQADKYGEGRHEKVYYNPQNPSESYLINKTEHSSGRDLFIVGVIYTVLSIIVGVILMTVVRKENKKREF